MSEERVEIRVAELLVRWMGGENLREATTELASIIREESASSYEEGYRFAREESARIEEILECLA
mgnify:FL=1|tara:strand:+ start:109 stop:303 length:195 start_codon:yes stop_codon:yes gene_type:complete